MIEAYKKFWINYFNFKGRSSRSDYWWVVLVNTIIVLIISLFTFINSSVVQTIIQTIATIFSIAIFIPEISISVRRLHDINKSGWYYLIGLVPSFALSICESLLPEKNPILIVITLVALATTIFMIMLYCMQSVDKKNKYEKLKK